MLTKLNQYTQTFFFFSPFIFLFRERGVRNGCQCDSTIASSTTGGLYAMIAGIQACQVWVELGRVKLGFT